MPVWQRDMAAKQSPNRKSADAATRGPLMRRLRQDRSGTVSMMFGLLVIPIAATIGLAVDFGRVYHVMANTQDALDSAALAAGRAAQVEKVDTINKAATTANAYFNEAKPANVVESTLTFTPNAQQTEFKVTATSWVRTPFLGVLHSLFGGGSDAGAPSVCQGNKFGCIKVMTTATAALCPSQACVGGSGDNKNSEVALMLDVTGSMGGQKLTDLKNAAKELIDIVVYDDGTYTGKVALAPFSQAVNAGTYFTKVTGLSDDADPDGNGYKDMPASCFRGDGSIRNSCKNDSQYWLKKYSKCVVERTGTEAFTDASPATKYLNSLDVVTGDDLYTAGNSACKPANSTVLPLTTNSTALKAVIDGFTADGNTAGHLGTAWAWYLISPNWADVWPTASKPAPYGTQNVRKIAVLMTDGEYNKEYKLLNNGNSTTQARTLCTNMKKTGTGQPNIEIFTVGFDLGNNNTAIDTLKQCASSSENFCQADTGSQLQACFKAIALKIVKLRLTN